MNDENKSINMIENNNYLLTCAFNFNKKSVISNIKDNENTNKKIHKKLLLNTNTPTDKANKYTNKLTDCDCIILLNKKDKEILHLNSYIEKLEKLTYFLTKKVENHQSLILKLQKESKFNTINDTCVLNTNSTENNIPNKNYNFKKSVNLKQSKISFNSILNSNVLTLKNKYSNSYNYNSNTTFNNKIMKNKNSIKKSIDLENNINCNENTMTNNNTIELKNLSNIKNNLEAINNNNNISYYSKKIPRMSSIISNIEYKNLYQNYSIPTKKISKKSTLKPLNKFNNNNINNRFSRPTSPTESHYNKIKAISIINSNKCQKELGSYLGINESYLKQLVENEIIKELKKVINDNNYFVNYTINANNEELIAFSDRIKQLIRDYQQSITLILSIKKFFRIVICDYYETNNIMELLSLLEQKVCDFIGCQKAKIFLYDYYEDILFYYKYKNNSKDDKYNNNCLLNLDKLIQIKSSYQKENDNINKNQLVNEVKSNPIINNNNNNQTFNKLNTEFNTLKYNNNNKLNTDSNSKPNCLNSDNNKCKYVDNSKNISSYKINNNITNDKTIENTDSFIKNIFECKDNENFNLKELIKNKTNKGIIGWVFSNLKKLNIDNIYSDERYCKDIDNVSDCKCNNMMVFPLFDKNNKKLGVIQLINKIDNNYNNNNSIQNKKSIIKESSSINKKYYIDNSTNNNNKFTKDDEELLEIFNYEVSKLINNSIIINNYKEVINKTKLLCEFSYLLYDVKNKIDLQNIIISFLKDCFKSRQVKTYFIEQINNKNNNSFDKRINSYCSNLNVKKVINYSYYNKNDILYTDSDRFKNSLFGLVYKTKKYFGYNNNEDSEMYNENFDIQSSDSIYTFPIIRNDSSSNAINNTSSVDYFNYKNNKDNCFYMIIQCEWPYKLIETNNNIKVSDQFVLSQLKNMLIIFLNKNSI